MDVESRRKKVEREEREGEDEQRFISELDGPERRERNKKDRESYVRHYFRGSNTRCADTLFPLKSVLNTPVNILMRERYVQPQRAECDAHRDKLRQSVLLLSAESGVRSIAIKPHTLRRNIAWRFGKRDRKIRRDMIAG